MLSWKSLYPPSTLLPNLPTPASWPWHYPILGHMIFTRPRASPPIDWKLDHPLLHMQLETWALGVLVSSYCCSTYRVADPFSSLGTFSSSSIGGPMFHPIADCEHPLLCLPGPSIASQETAISGSFQQNLASIFNSSFIYNSQNLERTQMPPNRGGYRECGTFTQLSTTQLLKRMNLWNS